MFFAVYGRALQAPQQFAEFLERVVVEWMRALILVCACQRLFRVVRAPRGAVGNDPDG